MEMFKKNLEQNKKIFYKSDLLVIKGWCQVTFLALFFHDSNPSGPPSSPLTFMLKYFLNTILIFRRFLHVQKLLAAKSDSGMS